MKRARHAVAEKHEANQAPEPARRFATFSGRHQAAEYGNAGNTPVQPPSSSGTTGS
jgi:hypothetical protein